MTNSTPIKGGGLVTWLKEWKAKRKTRHDAPPNVPIAQTSRIELPSGQVPTNQNLQPAASMATRNPTDEPSVCVQTKASALNAHDNEEHFSLDCSSAKPAKSSDLWREAFDQVDDETKKSFDINPILSDNTAQIDELIKMVKQKVEKFERESWKMKINGKERTWSANGQRVIAGIQDIGNIVIAFAPEPASTIWSAVKVLLNVSLFLSDRTVYTLILIMSTDARQSMQRRCCYPWVRREGPADHQTCQNLRNSIPR